MKHILLLTTALIIGCSTSKEVENERSKTQNEDTASTGDYMGQQKPGLVPQLFTPDFIDTNKRQLSALLHPNGKELYYTIFDEEYEKFTIMVSKFGDGKWSKPTQIGEKGKDAMIPAISQDGQQLYFGSVELISENAIEVLQLKMAILLVNISF